MVFKGVVGNTFRIRNNRVDNPLYVVLTKPNNGNVIIVDLRKPIKRVQTFGVYTLKHGTELFRINKTPNFANAQLIEHNKILDHVGDDPNLLGPDCPYDVVLDIVLQAFISGLPSNKVLSELAYQYPIIYEKYKSGRFY